MLKLPVWLSQAFGFDTPALHLALLTYHLLYWTHLPLPAQASTHLGMFVQQSPGAQEKQELVSREREGLSTVNQSYSKPQTVISEVPVLFLASFVK
jgi:hypothetical protein